MKISLLFLLTALFFLTCTTLSPQGDKAESSQDRMLETTSHKPHVPYCKGQIQGPLVKGQGIHANSDRRYPTPEPGMRSQPAPAYFSEMSECPFHSPWLPPQDAPNVGRVDRAGDCSFSEDIVCHYHVGPEFCPASDRDCDQKLIEIHCIVADASGGQPTVHGFQLSCSDGFTPAVTKDSWQVGKVCGRGLFALFGSCPQQRCCREGTLTAVDGGGRQHYGLRPNFAICDKPLDVSCSEILGNMKPHTNHAPHLGVVPE